MSQRYRIPAQTHRVEEEINRSRFITLVGQAATVEAARAFVAAARAEFPDATHHCWAYLVGPPGSTGQIGYSDDGEPHGTAGRPMFTVIEHSGLGDVVVVVVRYFGGIKLGTGGLVRAYSGGVKLALASLPVAERVPQADLLIVIDYSSVTLLRRMLPVWEALVIEETFAADVTVHVRLPADKAAGLRLAVEEATQGRAGVIEA